MQTNQMFDVSALSLDSNGGLRMLVNGQMAVLKPSNFKCRADQRQQWGENLIGKGLRVRLTGKKIRTPDAGELLEVTTACYPDRQVQAAQVTALVESAAESSTRHFPGRISRVVTNDHGKYACVEIGGRRPSFHKGRCIFKGSDPITVTIFADWIGHDLFDRLYNAETLWSVTQVVPHLPRLDGDKVRLEAHAFVKEE